MCVCVYVCVIVRLRTRVFMMREGGHKKGKVEKNPMSVTDGGG